jgi:hypothetical protein
VRGGLELRHARRDEVVMTLKVSYQGSRPGEERELCSFLLPPKRCVGFPSLFPALTFADIPLPQARKR